MKYELDKLGLGLILNESVEIYFGEPKEMSRQKANLSKTEAIFSFLNQYTGSIEKEELDNATVEDLVQTESFDEIYHLILDFIPLSEETFQRSYKPLLKAKHDYKL